MERCHVDSFVMDKGTESCQLNSCDASRLKAGHVPISAFTTKEIYTHQVFEKGKIHENICLKWLQCSECDLMLNGLKTHIINEIYAHKNISKAFLDNFLT